MKSIFSNSNHENFQGGCYPIFYRIANQPMFLKLHRMLGAEIMGEYSNILFALFTDWFQKQQLLLKSLICIAKFLTSIILDVKRKKTVGTTNTFFIQNSSHYSKLKVSDVNKINCLIFPKDFLHPSLFYVINLPSLNLAYIFALCWLNTFWKTFKTQEF